MTAEPVGSALRGNGVLISGGASGLGAEVADLMTSYGGQVTILDLTSNGHPSAQHVGGDVRDFDACLAAAKTAAQAPRGLRLVVACAGIVGPERLLPKTGEPQASDSFARVLDINMLGTLNLLRAGAAVMALNKPDIDGHRGVCVLTSSVSATEGQVGQVAYAASKAGVAGMTLAAACDLADRGIRVVSIAPGVFATPMYNEQVSGKARAGIESQLLFPKRPGHPAEFASMVAYTATNKMLNGVTIRLDGGIRMNAR
ncbi:SDR family NAD(P)-dependent oxidoreductase [Kribbella capetownensis]|uniref:SDR family NAD(P)-dependent oxidoreductase n=1 Tax=Kribbella capetownensis TaxID=1572659 RepID=A0A4R0IWW5_9ACTN|nr:SDR family NAD(P)-dependent oxidoreductase [Kribbella capetownensis]